MTGTYFSLSSSNDRGVADGQPGQPLFSVVAGNPTEEELAALVAVVTSLQLEDRQKDRSAMALWQRRLNRGQRMGVKLRPGPGSWRLARPM